MRIFLRPQVVATLAAIVAGVCLLCADQPVSAQTSVYPQNKTLTDSDVRLGVELPLNSNIKKNIGTTLYAIGGDHVLRRSGTSDLEVLSADYMTRSAGSDRIQLIPIAFGVQHIQNATAAEQSYFGLGVEAAPTTLHIPDRTGVVQSYHTTLYGAYLRAGMQLGQNVILDARYHFLQDVHGVNPSGPELTVGMQF
jgi:hypothetical protein